MSSHPPAGWYDDGTTAGALRWFDGSRWTEHTMLNPAAQMRGPVVAPSSAVGGAPGPGTSTFGGAPTSTFGVAPARFGQSLNLADRVSTGEQYQQNRLDEALGLRRRGFSMFGAATAILLVTGLIGLVTGASGILWCLSAGGAVFLLVRAWRDYQNATFRGAPALNALTWVGAGAALAAAVAFFVVGPAIGALGTMGT